MKISITLSLYYNNERWNFFLIGSFRVSVLFWVSGFSKLIRVGFGSGRVSICSGHTIIGFKNMIRVRVGLGFEKRSTRSPLSSYYHSYLSCSHLSHFHIVDGIQTILIVDVRNACRICACEWMKKEIENRWL